ncbi:MAG: M1 family metallopeptidase [Planctomycetota bacterium]|jgi:hypothetical protein
MSRRGLLLLWAFLALLAHLLPGWLPGPRARADLPTESLRTLTYEIDAVLDPETHQVKATGTLTWRNDASVPVEDLQFHLYLNAFRDRKSTFMRESGGSHRGHRFKEDAPGGIELTALARDGGADLLPNGEFISPDDGNPDDATVFRVPLDQPVAPGETVVLNLAWTSTLPKVFARTGFGGDFYMVAQWFPKLGVFEDEPPGGGPPGWNCHQFHGSSEFFADYGEYRVRITVPAAYAGKVGGSGKIVGETAHEDGSVTYEFHVEDVHDFAWVCDTDFVVFEGPEYDFDGVYGTDEEELARVAEVLGRDPRDVELTPVRIRLLLQPEHADQAHRHRDAVWHALTYMGLWLGRYPYETLTVVDPDHRGRDAGGMEYPTLITAGTRYVIADRGWTPQFVIVHEFGHQHFYGLVGTNEFENAWMDEGMCTYITAHTLREAYPPSPSFEWYADFPVQGERPLPFGGWIAKAPTAFPVVVKALRDDWKVPFGSIGLVSDIADRMDVEAPESIGFWPSHGEVKPLSFLREVPTLTLLRPNPISVREAERTRYASYDLVDPIAGTFAWRHMDRGSYGNNSYRRTANALRTLEGLLGEDTMLRAMRAYTEKYRFGHPTPGDFFREVEVVAAADGRGDVGWFFDEAFRRAATLDFGVGEIRVEDLPGQDDVADDEKEKESIVIVRRYGGIRFPTEILVRFADDSIARYRWERNDGLTVLGDGPPPDRMAPPLEFQGRWLGLRFRGRHPVVLAQVDPERRVDLDVDRLNDGLRAEGEGAPVALGIALRVMGWVQMSTSFYGGL